MSTTNLEQALLSQASYSNLDAGTPSGILADQLVNGRASMTTAQAQLFASQFEVVDQYDGTPFVDAAAGVSFTSIEPTGLSATVFKRRGIDTDISTRGHQYQVLQSSTCHSWRSVVHRICLC